MNARVRRYFCRDTAKITAKSSRSHPLSRNLTEPQPSATAEVYYADGARNAAYEAILLLLWPRRQMPTLSLFRLEHY